MASEEEMWGRRVRQRRWEEDEELEERERKREWYGDGEVVVRRAGLMVVSRYIAKKQRKRRGVEAVEVVGLRYGFI